MTKAVVILEDDPDVREELEAALRHEGFVVHSAENGREGLYLLTRLGDSPLVLVDLMMPVLSGWHVIDWLQQIGSASPIIVITAVGDVAEVPGVAGFVRKPLNLDELLPLVHAHAA